MLNEFHIFAPAKINFGLKVLQKQKDGFHKIESIFQSLSLKDELIVELLADFGSCNVFCKQMELPLKNTLALAYNAFCEVTGKSINSINVELIKNIPSGGGLGGGSSDAAFLVRALEKLNNITLTNEQLDKIASKVGSDVFFFFHCDENYNGAAIVTGRGEFVKKIDYRKDLHILLVFPKVYSSTKEAYNLVDKWKNCGNLKEYPALNELESIYNKPIKDWTFVNSFTEPLSEQYPEIANALNCVRSSGALYSEMSGSGSTVFGLYSSFEELEKAKNFMQYKGFDCVIAN